ncbi:MAG: porin family protein [Prevotella sp.]|nr:porin family protein [Prevotella sp.]
MKKILIATLLLVSTLSANAQREKHSGSLRTYAGMNFSSVNSDPNYNVVVGTPKTKLGLVVGADIEYQINNIFAISGGLKYSQMGYKLDGGKNISIDCIDVPLLFHAYFLKGFGVYAGVQPGLNVNIDKSIEPYVEDMKADILAGITYEFKNIVLDLSYTRVLSITSDDYFKNKAFTVTLGYRFELFKRELKDPSKNKYNIIMPSIGY